MKYQALATDERREPGSGTRGSGGVAWMSEVGELGEEEGEGEEEKEGLRGRESVQP